MNSRSIVVLQFIRDKSLSIESFADFGDFQWLARSRIGYTCIVPLLLALLLAACAPPAPTKLQIDFELRTSHLERCDEDLFSFYVADPQLIDAQGRSKPLLLDQTSAWQSQRVALVSLAGDCGAGGENRGNSRLLGSIPPGDYLFVEFLLGVPFELNHLNPLGAPPPLDVPAMFWTWQTGYKFMRLDLGNRWAFHLGSTGCHSASAVRAPAEPCRQPNLARIRVPLILARSAKVIVDLDALLSDIWELETQNCVEAYGEKPKCGMLVERLGLDVQTGRCVNDCAAQVLFRGAQKPA